MPSPLSTVAPTEIPPVAPAPAYGDACSQCDGHLVISSSHDHGAFYVRFLKCWKCKSAPENGKVTVPADTIRKRRRRS
jgi:hypothetical protein